MDRSQTKVVIIGAGIGGLAAALRLSHAGLDVTVLETHGAPGGKMRTVPSAAGPIDAGPTVLTMKPVFERLFASVGLRLDDHLTLEPLKTLARHYWDDGTSLDLMADQGQSRDNVVNTFGQKSAKEFDTFSKKAARLFDAFDEPMMQSASPSVAGLVARTLRSPRLIADMAPLQTLAKSLDFAFSEPKLRQLFGRYATYVGGSPFASPALLSLIWTAEARGVWTVKGGMHALASILAEKATEFGASFVYNAPVQQINASSDTVVSVETKDQSHPADIVVFNGDPRALNKGLLGPKVETAANSEGTEPRSLSAYVGSFAAKPSGPSLAHHTVFFGHDRKEEFDAIARGKMPTDATLYLCAQDSADTPDALQRFEVIMNAPPSPGDEMKEKEQCQRLIFNRFQDFDLSFSPEPGPEQMATPATFERMFPASLGSLYGRSPHGMTSALKRPQARTKIRGLYLCGGGAHPGAGVPMATLSGQHAAEAILSDQTSTSTSRLTATPGGMSMASATADPKQSLS